MAGDPFLDVVRQELARGTKIQREALGAIVAALEDARRAILAELAGQPTDYRRWSMARLMEEIDRVLTDLRDASAAALTKGLRDAAGAGAALVDRPLKIAGLDLATLFPRITPAAIGAIDAGALKHAAGITRSIRAGIERSLRQVVIGTIGPFDAMRAIGAILGEGGRDRAAVIVRTEVGRAYSRATQDRMEQGQVLAPELKKQWRRSGKRLSRIEHDAIDGQVQPVSAPFQVDGEQLMYPRDPKGSARNCVNCGCVSIPYLPNWRMSQPGRRPFTAEEVAKDPRKKWLEDALGSGAPPAAAAATAIVGTRRPTDFRSLGRPAVGAIDPRHLPARPPRDMTMRELQAQGQSKEDAFNAVKDSFRARMGLPDDLTAGTLRDPVGLGVRVDYRLLAHLLTKPAESRERLVTAIRQTIETPFEIWETPTLDATMPTTRTYIGLFSESEGKVAIRVVVRRFEDGWRPVTALREDHIDRNRRGIAIYTK
ncbi:MAG: hypothetical protein GC150_15400 [Rhizobiales bacterium]|nr:hypothetical protein [Hyphomicrobiales bacterium]